MTLGSSRKMMAASALDQKLSTLLRMHESPFYQLCAVRRRFSTTGGRRYLAGVDERARLFFDFCALLASAPWLCRLYRAQTKGKVESSVKHVPTQPPGWTGTEGTNRPTVRTERWGAPK